MTGTMDINIRMIKGFDYWFYDNSRKSVEPYEFMNGMIYREFRLIKIKRALCEVVLKDWEKYNDRNNGHK